MTLNNTFQRSDLLGALASGLCLIHCIATPFLFVAHAGASHHAHEHGHGHGHESPLWWGTIDILFLVISLAAVYWSARKSSRNWVKYSLWMAWGLLTFIILNEKMAWMHLPEEVIYVPALGLVGLHIYNQRYCQCEDEECCANPATPNA